MGLNDTERTFSTDNLRIEVTGPTRPNLTLVDFPGLFQASNREQSTKDSESISDFVRSYMKKPLRIILAVVSAKIEFVLQVVTKHARELDPSGQRTIGLITKPDTLDVGSDTEQYYFSPAQNQDVNFRLGWHVVRNRDFMSRNVSNEERDQLETDFLSQGRWAALPWRQKGIPSLRLRLSEVLTNQILEQLPKLLIDVGSELQNCLGALGKLGSARSTAIEQRHYLLQASSRFASLMKDIVSGIYADPFFGSAFDEDGYKRRLRVVVQNVLTEFSETMRLRGHARKIVDNGYDIGLDGETKDGSVEE
jgi:hypothetical protein